MEFKLFQKILKKYFINKIILANETYTDEQLQTIVNYCKSDVKANKELFLKQIEDIEKKEILTGHK